MGITFWVSLLVVVGRDKNMATNLKCF